MRALSLISPADASDARYRWRSYTWSLPVGSSFKYVYRIVGRSEHETELGGPSGNLDAHQFIDRALPASGWLAEFYDWPQRRLTTTYDLRKVETQTFNAHDELPTSNAIKTNIQLVLCPSC